VSEPDEIGRAAALELAERMAAFWERRLGKRLLGFYLIGSLAHGGFSRRYSDIDVALIAEDGLQDADRREMSQYALTLSPGLAAKLSLFWADRTFTVGRFPPLDRVDLVDHAVALVERERVRPPRPDRSEIRAYLADQPFATWADGARRFAAMATLEARDHKPYLRALLYPARFVFSWMTGRMGSNDEAVDFVVAQAPAGLDLELVTEALRCRHAASDPDPLFAARGLLPRQVEACSRLLDSDAGRGRDEPLNSSS
jgi:predicted nucleotidyltransferase